MGRQPARLSPHPAHQPYDRGSVTRLEPATSQKGDTLTTWPRPTIRFG